MTEWEIRIQPEYFWAILEGSKTVEGRPPKPDNHANYGEIEEGNILKFHTGEGDSESSSEFRVEYACFEAEETINYDSVKDMVEVEGLENVLPSAESLKEIEESYHNISGYPERIEEYGINAIRIGDLIQLPSIYPSLSDIAENC